MVAVHPLEVNVTVLVTTSLLISINIKFIANYHKVTWTIHHPHTPPPPHPHQKQPHTHTQKKSMFPQLREDTYKACITLRRRMNDNEDE